MLVNFFYAVLICVSSFGGPKHSNTEQENELLTLLKHGEPIDTKKRVLFLQGYLMLFH